MIQHKELAAGRWNEMSLVEQMANTGSEVERSLNWKEKNNLPFSEKAFTRALELLDLTIADPKNKSRLRELTRTREALVDFLWGKNEYGSSALSWRAYFSRFTYAARKHC